MSSQSSDFHSCSVLSLLTADAVTEQVDVNQPVLSSTIRDCELALGGLLDKSALADAIKSAGQIVQQLTQEGLDSEAIAVQYMQERMEQQSVQDSTNPDGTNNECRAKQGFGILQK